LAGAPGIYGPKGVTYIAFVFGPVVLLVNIICVAVLARWGDNSVSTRGARFGQILANPLILACAAGLIALSAGMSDVAVLTPTLKLLAPAAMPVALLCVGAGLDFSAVRQARAKVAAATSVKLLIGPIVLYAASRAFGVDPATAAIAAGLGATPTAAAAYTLAREMGGNAELMAAIITTTTLASFVTMPVMLALFIG
jgi:predicted permease